MLLAEPYYKKIYYPGCTLSFSVMVFLVHHSISLVNVMKTLTVTNCSIWF